ncbi:alanine racemase, N-terminal domain protein [Leptospira inadai serovar Lyme str. 10]|uniref:Alanine racemase, N-terminal domain protein n=2 Tax=Leptospira inadai serovar Lyme TaxID=293084 RepID=V6HT80_9LEPT|nr:alanine racemase [Leptospira inadai]EQA35879.1 alanine racemase, N-terminal domain protein [Leptospira inadai serovar Lyme str. 10]PNV76934.1 alanine racemase [Leptospira inadai serovar Lyme]
MHRINLRRWVLTILLMCVVLLAFLKPADRGAPYSEYFKSLNLELKQHGPGKPIVLLDLDRLDSNLQLLKEKLRPPLHYRIVVKSLPSLDLLRYIVRATDSDRLMVFHSEDIVMLLRDPEFRKFDILLGKPMPATALAQIFHKTSKASVEKIHWLVDTPDRAIQYLEFAKKVRCKLDLNLEIDIGLHRGGFPNPETMDKVLKLISSNPEYLSFSGFMGYEPHVASAPTILGNKITVMEEALEQSLDRYSSFIKLGRKNHPGLFERDLILNGGGSKTYRFYQKHIGIVNDVSVGSALVKPTDFDVDSLEDHTPAVFIATPVLKRLEGTTIPFLESVSFLFPIWDPNLQVTYFTYGGAFLAKKESPKGLQDNSLFGTSTNQGILNGSKTTNLYPDDYVFFRPSQSEKVMAEMGEIHLVRNGKLAGTWKCFLN